MSYITNPYFKKPSSSSASSLPASLASASRSPATAASSLTAKKLSYMSDAQAAHLLSTPSIANRGINLQRLEGSSPEVLFPKVKELVDASVQTGAPKPSPIFYKALSQVIETCESAAKFHSTNLPIEHQAAEFANSMQNRIRVLKIGESYTVPGGWKGRQGDGHAMLYKFERTGDATFTVKIYNTGGGLEYHPSQIDKDGKKRYLLDLTFTDIPLDNVINQDFWAAYFQIRFGSDKGEPFTDKNLYEGLFTQLIPNFLQRIGSDQNLSKARFLREQTGGVCTAQSLLTLLRECVGENYHELRDRVRACTLNNYSQILQESDLLANREGESKERELPKKLALRKGSIQLLQAEVERVAGDIHRDTTKRAQRFTDPKALAAVDENLSIVKQVAQKISQTYSLIADKCRLMRAYTFDIWEQRLPYFIPDISPIPTLPEKPIPLVGSPLLLDKPIWSSQPAEITTNLERWVKTIQEAFAQGSQADQGIYLWTQELFKAMPSVTGEPWTSLPAQQQMACIEHLSTLSTYLVRTHLCQTERTTSQCTVQACLTKASAVITFLARKQSGCKSMSLPIQEDFYNIKLWRKNAGFFLSDPKLNREYTEAVNVLARGEKTNWFSRLPFLIQRYMEYGVTSSSLNEAEKNTDLSTNEFNWVNNYLQKAENANTLNAIRTALSDKLTGDKDTDKLLIIAEGLANAKQYFPQSPLWIIQQQALLGILVDSTPETEFVNDLQRGPARSSSLFNYALDPKKLPKAVLKSSVFFNQDSSRVNRKNFPFPSPKLSDTFKEICQEWSSPHAWAKELRLHGAPGDNLKKAPEDIQELISFIWQEDPQHAAMKVVAYYREHMALLKEPLHQWILKSCLFSLDVLREQLTHPVFAESLVDFVQYGFLQAKTDISTSLFFLHLGDKLQNNCRHILSGSSISFPTISKHLRTLEDEIEKSESSPTQKKKDQACISATVLASYGNGEEIWQKDPEELLIHAFRFAAYKSFDKNSISLDLAEEAAAGSLCLTKLIKRLHKESPAECQGILSRAVAKFTKRQDVLQMKWEGFETTFPVLYTPERTYQIDLFTGQVWAGLSQEGMIPSTIIEDATFRSLFPTIGELTEISSTPLLSSFRDKNGIPYKAWKDYYGQIQIIRQIDGRWFHYIQENPERPLISQALSKQCSCWCEKIPSSPYTENTSILFIDKTSGKSRYLYDSSTCSLKCLEESPAKIPLYAVPQEKTSLEDFFRTFDPQPQLWKDSNGEAAVIELPNYQLLFDVTHPPRSEPVITCRAHPGYRLAKQQYLPQLIRHSGYIILVKESEDPSIKEEDRERIVLMPKKNLHIEGFFDDPLTEDWTSFNYYVYDLNSKGELDQATNLEARLFLAYLYTMLGEYKRAEKLLYTPHESAPLGAYSAEALGWLSDIAKGEGDRPSVFKQEKENSQTVIDRDLHAAALRLQAFMLKRENSEEWIGDHQDKVDSSEIDSCVQSQNRLPQDIFARIKNGFSGIITTLSKNGSSKKEDPKTDPDNWITSLENGVWYSEIDPDILAKPFLIEPSAEEMQMQFLSLYAIAYGRTPQEASKREILKTRLKMMHGTQLPFATLLLGCLTATDKELKEVWKSPDELKSLLEKPSFYRKQYIEEWYAKKAIERTLKDLLKQAEFFKDRFQETPVKIFRQKSEIETKVSAESTPTVKQPILVTPARAAMTEAVAQKIQKIKGEWFGQWHLFQQVDQKEGASDTSWHDVVRRLEPDLKSVQENAIAEYASHEIQEILKDASLPPSPQHKIDYRKLFNAKLGVTEQIFELTPAIEQLQREMLTLAQKLPLDPLTRIRRESELLSGKAKPLDLSTLLLCYLKGDASFYRKHNPALSHDDIQRLHALTEEFLLQSTWQQQLNRALDLIIKLEKVPSAQRNDKNTELLAQKLFDTLNAKREYSPQEHPEYLLFEYSCDMLLYKEQIPQIETLVEAKQWTILEILMGSGKTDVLLPLIALRKADGHAIPVIVLPDTLIQNFSPIIQRRLGTIFSQNLLRINWNGTQRQGMTLQELQRIRKTLEAIPEQGSCLVVSQMDMHKLVIHAKRAKINLARTGEPLDVQKWEEYQAILHLMKTRGQWLIDEVDLCLRPDFEMHQALDTGASIQPTRTAIGHLLYASLLQKFNDISFDFDPKPGKQPCTLQFYHQEIKPELIRSVIHQLVNGEKIAPEFGKPISEFAKEIREYRDEIEKYLNNPKEDLPEDMRVKTKDMLAFLRFQLHTLMPLTLHKLHGQNYGRFPEEDGNQSLLAGPYHMKDAPCLGSQFGLYGEQIDYTFESYLKEGVTAKDIEREVLRLQNELQHTLAHQGGDPSSLTPSREFRSYFDPEGKYDLMQLQAGHFREIAKSLSKDKLRLLRYVHLVLDRSLRTPKEQITSTPQQMIQLCATAKGMSGTVYANRKAFPKKFDDIQVAKGLHRKEIECIKRDNRILTISSQLSGTDFLDAMLKNDAQEKIKAIIDVGALLIGTSMNALAMHLLTKRPKLQAVIYYENDIAWILKRGQAPVPYMRDHDKEIDPANRFTIFDQKRCTGANILQDPEAEAYVTLHKTQTFRDLAQGAWRMRGIEKAQRVHLVVTDEIRTIIASGLGKPPEKLDTIDLIDHTLRNQAQQQARNGVKLIKQQLRGLFEETCDVILNKVPHTQWHQEPYRSLVFLSITELSDKPYRQYGKPVDEASAEEVLTAYGKNLLNKLDTWARLNADQIQDLEVDKVIAESDKQLRGIVEGAIKEGVVPTKLATQQGLESDQEVTTEVEQEKELEIEQQQEYDRDHLEVVMPVTWPSFERLCRHGDFRCKPLKEDEISEIRRKRNNLNHIYFWKQNSITDEDHPPILNANDALKLKPLANQLLQGINLFSDELLISANIPFVEKDGEAFGPIQVPRSRCLINQGPKGAQILLLGHDDSEAVINEISKAKHEGHSFALYNYKLGPKKFGRYATGKDPMNWDVLSAKPNFQELFVQYKFFCGEMNSYSHEEVIILKTWLGKHKGSLRSIETMFKQVLLTQSQRAGYQDSLLAFCFKDLNTSQVFNLKTSPVAETYYNDSILYQKFDISSNTFKSKTRIEKIGTFIIFSLARLFGLGDRYRQRALDKLSHAVVLSKVAFEEKPMQLQEVKKTAEKVCNIYKDFLLSRKLRKRPLFTKKAQKPIDPKLNATPKAITELKALFA